MLQSPIKTIVFLSLIFFGLSPQTFGQADSSKAYLSIGSNGITLGKKSSGDRLHTGKLHWLMIDLGLNSFKDKSDYNSPAAQQFLQVPPGNRNKDLFSMRPGKSVNVNIWPVLLDMNLHRSNHQRINFYTGIGIQLYNFRFTKNITFINETTPEIVMDSLNFTKNKLAFDNLAVPVMLNFKTRVGTSRFWLTYGIGVIGKYSLDIWTKQKSVELGKIKNHDVFNLNRFGLDLSAEFGVKGFIRIFGTYQMTNMYKTALVQYPYSIGFRFFGI